MRKVARVRNDHPSVKRVILYQDDHGVYLFPCATLDDGSAMGDEWFESLASAQAACSREFAIEASDWQSIEDPLNGCLHDWIAAVRIRRGADGTPLAGQLERLENGVWVEIPYPS